MSGGIQKNKNEDITDAASCLLTAVKHLKTFVQAATDMIAKYQPMLDEYATAQACQQGAERDIVDTLSLISKTSQHSETSNFRRNRDYDGTSIFGQGTGRTFSIFRTKR